MRTAWNLINITARTNQTPSHYIEAISSLQEQDPIVNVGGEKNVSIRGTEASVENTNGIPSWIEIELMSYVIINPDAFYSKARQERISMNWDSDIVANFKSAKVVFFPFKHIVAVRASSKIKYNQVCKYFQVALNRIEQDGFDVTICIDHNFIDSIRTAYEIVNIKATISFSNPTFTTEFESFQSELDAKMRDANPEKVDLNLYGSKTSPLNVSANGLVDATLNIAENNGTVSAVIKQEENSSYETVDSKDHPKKLIVEASSGNIFGALFNAIAQLFHG